MSGQAVLLCVTSGRRPSPLNIKHSPDGVENIHRESSALDRQNATGVFAWVSGLI